MIKKSRGYQLPVLIKGQDDKMKAILVFLRERIFFYIIIRQRLFLYNVNLLMFSSESLLGLSNEKYLI